MRRRCKQRPRARLAFRLRVNACSSVNHQTRGRTGGRRGNTRRSDARGSRRSGLMAWMIKQIRDDHGPIESGDVHSQEVVTLRTGQLRSLRVPVGDHRSQRRHAERRCGNRRRHRHSTSLIAQAGEFDGVGDCTDQGSSSHPARYGVPGFETRPCRSDSHTRPRRPRPGGAAAAATALVTTIVWVFPLARQPSTRPPPGGR